MKARTLSKPLFLTILSLFLFLPFTPLAADERPCVAWDISYEWDYRVSSGAYGTIKITQQPDGTFTGTFYNAAAGGSGTVEGNVNGSSVYFRSSADEDFRGNVDPSGRRISGTLVSNNQGTVVEMTGVARCLRRLPPPSADTRTIYIRYGAFRYLSYPCLTIFPGPDTIELEIEVILYGANLPDQIALRHLIDDVGEFPLPLLPRVSRSGNRNVYRRQIQISPNAPIGVGMWEFHRVLVQDPRTGEWVEAIKIRMDLIDPSGYIYDATDGSRLKGATVSCFVKQGDSWALWPAARYLQTNPQVSGVNGHYGWEVTEGDYQVRVSRACYQDAQSEVMHIPPPRTDVHIGMIPAGGCSPLALTQVLTADERGQETAHFLPGAEMEFHGQITNTSDSPVQVAVNARVLDPEGQIVPGLSKTYTYSIAPFGAYAIMPATLPTNLAEGKYTLFMQFTHQGQSAYGGTEFRVGMLNLVALPLLIKPGAPPATPTPTATARPTFTPTPAATRTSQPTNTPQPIYADDFSNPESGWSRSTNANRIYAYKNGEYQIRIRREYWYAGTTSGFRCTNCRIQVQGRFQSSNYGAYGILFGITDDWDEYLFRVSGNGYYSLYKRISGDWEALIPWTESPHIRQGQATNHLQVTRNKKRIALHVNGKWLAGLDDRSLQGNLRVGLTASAFDAYPVDARFDNFRVFPLGAPSMEGESTIHGLAKDNADLDLSSP
jgi:hypothetical protein